MRNQTMSPEDSVLEELLRRLIQAFAPERIYLFGSRARGETGPDSDYDLLLVLPDDAPPSADAAAWPTRRCGAPASQRTSWS